jgi:hypothetical protein
MSFSKANVAVREENVGESFIMKTAPVQKVLKMCLGSRADKRLPFFCLSNDEREHTETRCGHNATVGQLRCEASSISGVIQYLASNLIRHGYWFYFLGRIPDGKDARLIDHKLSERYGTNLDKFQRARRKSKGLANVAYVRFRREFLLVATEGSHHIFEEHTMRDFRRQHLRFHRYQIGAGRGHDGKYHASVRIDDAAFLTLASYFERLAVHRTAESLREEFNRVEFVPYARVRRQLLKILRLVNEARAASGYDALPHSVLGLRRTIVKVFDDQANQSSDALYGLNGGVECSTFLGGNSYSEHRDLRPVTKLRSRRAVEEISQNPVTVTSCDDQI